MGERSRELVVLIVGDVFCLAVSLYLTLLARYLSVPTTELLQLHSVPFGLLSFVWLFIFYIGGMYDKHTVFLKGVLFSRIINTQFVNILIAALLFLVVPFTIAPKTNLVIYLFISIVLITVWRLKLYNKLSTKHRYKAMLIADGEEAIELFDEVNNNARRYNYSFVCMIDNTTALHTPDLEKQFLTLIDQEHISMIVANPKGDHIEQMLPTLFDLAFVKFEFTFLDFHKVFEDTFDRVPLSALHYNWFINHVSHSKSLVYEVTKRIFDIVGSLLILLLLSCSLPLIIIAMRLEGKGSIFITQERIGRFNRPVRVYKLRTMTSNDASSSTWTNEDKVNGNVVTKVGAFLRKTSIDELPQCLNILKGEMSLIGPRNDIAGLGARLASEIPYYTIRNFVKPGVTGWAQTHQHYMGNNISPQSLDETRQRLAYDLFYVKNRSFFLDIEIALRTLKTILSRFGVTIRLPR